MNFRGPNPCCILTLDAMFVSCHCLMFFLTATNKTYFQNYIVCIVCISLSLLSHPKTLGPNR